jgi:hypothetical protein
MIYYIISSSLKRNEVLLYNHIIKIFERNFIRDIFELKKFQKSRINAEYCNINTLL